MDIVIILVIIFLVIIFFMLIVKTHEAKLVKIEDIGINKVKHKFIPYIKYTYEDGEKNIYMSTNFYSSYKVPEFNTFKAAFNFLKGFSYKQDENKNAYTYAYIFKQNNELSYLYNDREHDLVTMFLLIMAFGLVYTAHKYKDDLKMALNIK